MPEGKWDAVFILDLGKWSRMGKLQEAVSAQEDFIIDIDHHRSNTGCGDVSLIDPQISSTGELLYELFKYAGLEIDSETALLLYVAIATDTGRFSFDNTSARTHANAAELMGYGVDAQYVCNKVYRRLTVAQLQLYRRALDSLRVSDSGQVAWIVLRRRDFRETGTSALLTQDFVETPRSLEGVKIGIFFREAEEPGKVKVSMRSNIKLDLNGFSTAYGGGGHAAAAGITLRCSIEEAVSLIVPAVEAQLAGL
jgi:phosphoesterase RecJ-like protein